MFCSTISTKSVLAIKQAGKDRLAAWSLSGVCPAICNDMLKHEDAVTTDECSKRNLLLC